MDGEQVQGMVELLNSGNRPVHFTLSSSDPQLELEPMQGTIAARDQAVISLRGEFRPGRAIVDIDGAYGLLQATEQRLDKLVVGIRVDETPGKVEIDFSALDFFDEE